MRIANWLAGSLLLTLVACGSTPEFRPKPFSEVEVAQFSEPWAMVFLPDGRLLVTEKEGELKLLKPDGQSEALEVGGVPKVAYGGQGGLGDVVLHPQFGSNQLIYLSFAEADGEDDKLYGAAVARARLQLEDPAAPTLEALEVIWRQVPKMEGQGHYGHRLAFDSAGMLWITSGERQQFDPAQDMQSNLGKVVRLHDDGRVPLDNPFVDQGEVSGQIWSLGHRNPLGMAFDAGGNLWVHEMGPQGGDELNLIERGSNYGYPIVSDGDHYGGGDIPDHHTRPEFNAPEITWTPVIAPAGFIIYSGSRFPDWKGSGLIGGLASQALVRVELEVPENAPARARELERFDMGARIREVEQGPDGDVWLLTDAGGLWRLSPKAGS